MISINKRKIGICILLSIVTFGIYLIYWEYLLVKNIRAIQGDKSSCTGEMLCLVFVPFYSMFWWLTRGKIAQDKFSEHGYSAVGNGIAYLLLNVFGLSIVSMAIMQNDFNSLRSESIQSNQRSAIQIVDKGVDKIIALVIFGYKALSNVNLYIYYIGIDDLKVDRVCYMVGSILMICFIISTIRKMLGKGICVTKGIGVTGVKTVGFIIYAMSVVIRQISSWCSRAIFDSFFIYQLPSFLYNVLYTVFDIALVWVAIYKLEKWIKK